MQKSRLRNIALVVFGMLFLGACTSKTIVPPSIGNVSFSNNVVPIFTKNCALTGCHVAGNVKPDLTLANAYNSLISLRLVDTITPENSVVYRKISTGGTMNKYLESPTDAQIILYWIKQGAKNN